MNELLAKRAKAIEQARAILDNAEKEKREMSAEERQNYDKLFAEAKGLKEQIDRIEADERRKLELATAEAEIKASGGRRAGMQEADGGNKPKVIELRKSVCGDARRIEIPSSDLKLRESFREYLLTNQPSRYLAEARALQKDIDASGGYLSAPMEFMAELLRDLDNETFMRQISRVLPPLTSAESLGVPTVDSRLSAFGWGAELSIGAADSSLAFGRRELAPHMGGCYILVSKTLLRRSGVPVDEVVRTELAYDAAIGQEQAFMTGSGAGRPLGIFTASANGIPTTRNYATGNTTTAITFDGLIGCKYNLKPQYRKTASWIFHTDALLMISKIKDGEGRYIWRESVRENEPDRLLNLPYRESQYAPNTFEAGLYVGMLGDFRFYWVVDALTMTIQVLLELFVATNQNAYVLRLETDAMPVKAEAFSRLTLAAG